MKSRVFCLLGLGIVILPACTAVLGMDRAELAADAGPAGQGGAGGTSSSGGAGGQLPDGLKACGTVKPDCVTCLKGCGDLDACLAKGDCRRALNQYGNCLGQSCGDPNGDCSEALGSIADPNAQRLSECLSFDCAQSCTGSVAITKCQRYCSCMQESCNTDFKTWASMDECLRNCDSLLDERVQDCRGRHCEYGLINSDHCKHAMGKAGFDPCKTTQPPKLCLDKSDVKGPCAVNADCCPGLTCQTLECG